MLCVLSNQRPVDGFNHAMRGSQGDGRNNSERIDHLTPVMADFHVQMNFLKLIWKHLHKAWLDKIDRVD